MSQVSDGAGGVGGDFRQSGRSRLHYLQADRTVSRKSTAVSPSGSRAAGVLSVMQSPGTDLADLVLKEQKPARMAHG